jgi:cyclic pyranopterin phosphate synthase
VSLDTLSRETFTTLAHRDQLPGVLAGLSAAAAAGLAPVKVNTVLIRGINDHQATPLLRFCLNHGYQPRFIEQMPLDAQHGWQRSEVVTTGEILAALPAEFSLTPADPASRGSAPAKIFPADGGPARAGVIGSVTRPFCAASDRARLTADGQTRNCLFTHGENDPRTPHRTGADHNHLATIWRHAAATKLPGHGINNPGSSTPPGQCQPSAANRQTPPLRRLGPGPLSRTLSPGAAVAILCLPVVASHIAATRPAIGPRNRA